MGVNLFISGFADLFFTLSLGSKCSVIYYSKLLIILIDKFCAVLGTLKLRIYSYLKNLNYVKLLSQTKLYEFVKVLLVGVKE